MDGLIISLFMLISACILAAAINDGLVKIAKALRLPEMPPEAEPVPEAVETEIVDPGETDAPVSCGWGERRANQIDNADRYLARVGEKVHGTAYAILTHDMPQTKHPEGRCTGGCFICSDGFREPELQKYRALNHPSRG